MPVIAMLWWRPPGQGHHTGAPEFVRFASASLEPFSRWFTECHLAEIEPGESPKALIEEISESLLAAYATAAAHR